ncbi:MULTISPECIES: MobF family relaxase [Actinomycetes]|nr:MULTISPECIES: MobF family relaxase [Actinomycetes]AHI20865.1 conjugative relaxase domain protein, TrwC/TraI family [Corynebacterium casei LMG S-19264]
MTIRPMSAGRGYEYLLKTVAAGDGDRDLGTPLTRYYTESGSPPGTWLGTGLASLDDGTGTGVDEGSTVTEEHLARLLGQGVHPVTGAKLGHAYPSLRPPRERIADRVAKLAPDMPAAQREVMIQDIRDEEAARKPKSAIAGFDLTFSPPKSLSTLWGVADAPMQELLAQAHHAAMRDTVAMLEERVASTRVGKGGIARMPITGVIATAFDHYDSRAADPQLHTHLVVSNKVQGEDGKWRSLDSRRLHKATVALSASYNAYLIDHTADLLGLTWEPVDRGKDRNTGWEITGIPAELIAEFSRRSTGSSGGVEGIEQAKNRLIRDYRDAHGHAPSPDTIARLRQQATLETRPEKELHSLAELTADWRERATRLLGTDATTWAQDVLTRTPDASRLRAEDLGAQQVEDLAAVVVMTVADRRSTWTRWNLHAEAMRQLMSTRFTTPAERTAVLDQIVAGAEAQSLRLTPEYDRAVPGHYVDGSGNRFQSSDQVAYSSQEILDAEHRLLKHADDTSAPRLPSRMVARHVSRKIQGVRLADDQAAAVTRIACSGRSLDLLVGPAGAGKTTALRGLHRAWTARHGQGSVIGLAPSAAAAEVLGESLGVQAENTAKFLYEHERGRWDFQPGQLILLDEASLAGTLTLDRIAEHAGQAGAKLVLVGDPAQLSSVETGGAFGMLVRHRPGPPTLTDARRFVHEWEKTASLDLRRGKTAVLEDYENHGRLVDGSIERMLDAAYTAWQQDRDEGLATLMIAGNAEMVAELNTRAREDLIADGRVERDGIGLHDGTTAGVGDLVVTRRNDRQLSLGRSWVKNGDRWSVARRLENGALAVRRLGPGDQPAGAELVLPAEYVAEDVELGYATTVHRAQGASVDTVHALVDPETASRELFYVAMTRGKQNNTAYIIQPDPHEIEPHLETAEPLTRIEQLHRVLARSDADLSATETLKHEVDRHASLATLVHEYDVLAREAQVERSAAYLDVAPFPEAVADDVFTSPHYEQLEAAITRHEATGHSPTRVLTALAPRLQPTSDEADPAAHLASMIDTATAQMTHGRTSTPGRVGGLIARPAEPLDEDMRTALRQREALIDAAAGAALDEAVDHKVGWATQLGAPGPSTREREWWRAHAVTIALYRQRYDIQSAAPLGSDKDVESPQQADERRTAQVAYSRLRTQHSSSSLPRPERTSARRTSERGL